MGSYSLLCEVHSRKGSLGCFYELKLRLLGKIGWGNLGNSGKYNRATDRICYCKSTNFWRAIIFGEFGELRVFANFVL